jgi:predicted permease
MTAARWAGITVRALARLVASRERGDWLREWEAELDHAAREVRGAWPLWTCLARRVAAAAEDALLLALGRARRSLPAAGPRDVRFAARSLARAPLFTGAVVVTLGLGVGANTAVFTVLNAVLLEGLPYPEAGRLVQLLSVREGLAGSPVSTPDFDDLVERSRSLEHLSLRVPANPTYQADRPIVLTGAGVSSGYLRLFGTAPYLGRYFLPEDDERGVTPSVVLAHGTWQTVFGAAPELVGGTVTLDGRPHVVIGVAEPGLRDPVGDVDLWTSRPVWIELERRGQGWLNAFARVAPNATLEQAQAETESISEDLAREHPGSNAGRIYSVASLHGRLVDPARPVFLVLVAAVGLVLLITCANVANLILARSAGRGRELAVRASLGAGRAGRARPHLVEGLLLAALGGALGLAVAAGATKALVALGAPGVPRLADLRVDGAVLSFTLLVSAATGIAFGMVPLIQVSEVAPSRTLHEEGRSGEGRRARAVRRALVAAEVAVSMVLLVGAGLLVRSLAQLTRVDTGVLTEGVLAFRVSHPPARTDPADLRAFYDAVRAGIARLPAVKVVGGVNSLPLGGGDGWYGFLREDGPPLPSGESRTAQVRVVEPGYFESVGIPLLAGRVLDGRDGADAPPVLLVDRETARRHFPGEDPVGKRITLPWGAGVPPMTYEIVGVVGDVLYQGPTAPPMPTLYLPRAHDSTPQWLNLAFWVTVRAGGDPLALADAAMAAVWDVDRTVPIREIGPLERHLQRHRSGTRNQALLIGSFALLATVLAAVGVGGVVSYAVARRGHEIGVRQALGADAGDVVRLVLAEGVRLVAIGLPVGLLAALAGSRLLGTLLFRVEPDDPLTYGAVAAGLAAVVLASAWIPARRAAGVPPAAALRSDG